jgi:hypothetical protein
MALFNLCHLMNDTGNFGAARAYVQETLRINVELNNPEGIAGCLIALALLGGRGPIRAERDARLLGASEVLREKHSLPISENEIGEYANGVAEIRALLGEKRFAEAWVTGRTMPREEMIRRALRESGDERPDENSLDLAGIAAMASSLLPVI